MNKTLVTNVSNATESTGGFSCTWVDLEQKEYEDATATQGEIASVVDSLYDIDPCNPEKEATVDPDSIWGAPPEETFDLIVQELLAPEFCDFTDDGSYTATLNLFVSDLSKPYKLVLSKGVVGLTSIVTKDIEERLVIENASSHTLKYPVYGDIEANWLNKVYLSGNPSSAPQEYPPCDEAEDWRSKITESGNALVSVSPDRRTLTWGGVVTGTLEVKYSTQYYEISVYVPSESYTPVTSIATVFYSGLVDEQTINPPDVDDSDPYSKGKWCLPDDLQEFKREIVKVPFPDHDVSCYLDVTVRLLCNCTESLHSTYRVKEYVSCPDRTRCYDNQTKCELLVGYKTISKYVECGETTEDMNSPEFYEEKCCEPPPEDMNLPSCKRKYSDTGTFPIDEEVEKRYLKDYGEGVVTFISVLPEDGYCGKQVVEQVLIARKCCDQPPPLYFTRTVDLVEWDSSYWFCVEGGVPPYSWSAEGAGISISGSSSCATLSVNDCFCAPGQVIVTDSCGQTIAHGVTSEEGSWVSFPYSQVPRDTGITGYYDGYIVAGKCDVEGQNDKYRIKQPFGRFGYGYGPNSSDEITKEEAIALSCAYDGAKYDRLIIPSNLNQCDNSVNSWYEGYQSGGDIDLIYSVYPLEYGAAAWKWECPNEAEELVYDEENSAEVIADNSSGTVVVTGGKDPYSVTVSGQGYFLDNSRTHTEGSFNSTSFTIYTGDACGICNITVTDKCGQVVEGAVTSTNGEWVQTYRNNGGGVHGLVIDGEVIKPPLEGGCPFTDYTTTHEGWTYRIKNGISIEQAYGHTCVEYMSRQPLDYALEQCEEAANPARCSSIFNRAEPGTGCFYERGDESCSDCGKCVSLVQGEKIEYRSADLGLHTKIEYNGSYGYGVSIYWETCNYTIVEEWRC